MFRILKDFLIVFVLVVAGLAAIVVFVRFNESDDSQSADVASAATVATAPATPVDFSDPDHEIKNQNVPDAACRKSLACMADKDRGWAEVSCKKAIEAKAVYQVKWTDGMFQPLFSQIIWNPAMPDEKSIGYVGDRAQVQNQFGAFANVNYECWWNPYAEKVTDVEISLGRMPSG